MQTLQSSTIQAQKKILYTPLNCKFKCPTVSKWSTSLTAFENYRCPNVSGCSHASLFMEDQRKLFTPPR